MGFIQTVRGKIEATELGVCYGHEHLLGRPPADTAPDEDVVLVDEEAALQELARFRRAGGSAVVEMSTADYGRDAAGLRRLSERSGVHIICATGYNKDKFSARFTRPAAVDALADRFVRDIEEGIDESRVRAGLVKASSTLHEITSSAEKLFRAAAQTHHRTGAPISTHTEAGTMALAQLRLLAAEGVDLRHVVIGHMDRKLDLAYHLDAAAAGAYVSYDQISKSKYYADTERAAMIARLIDAGFGSQVLLGGDLARRSYWPAYGFEEAAGFAYILETFVPLLREHGLDPRHIDDLLIHNPARAFTFARPRS